MDSQFRIGLHPYIQSLSIEPIAMMRSSALCWMQVEAALALAAEAENKCRTSRLQLYSNYLITWITPHPSVFILTCLHKPAEDRIRWQIQDTASMNLDIYILAHACLNSFNHLINDLHAHPTELMPKDAVRKEHDRFRVWCGNLGALKRGLASLDYRLRESPIMLSNLSKMLQELMANLSESPSSTP